MKKAVIFDMDGLMIDSERETWQGYEVICRKYGYEMDLAFYKKMLGFPMPVVRKMLMEHFGEAFPLEKVIKEVHDRLEEKFSTEGVPVKPGLMEILAYTRERGYRTLVATSSDRDRVERILCYAGIEGYFDEIVCGNEVEKGKPNPDIFQKGCEKLGIKPEEAYVLEDSEQGITAAFRAGIPCICIPDMKEPGEECRKMAFRITDSLLGAMDIMEQLQ